MILPPITKPTFPDYIPGFEDEPLRGLRRHFGYISLAAGVVCVGAAIYTSLQGRVTPGVRMGLVGVVFSVMGIALIIFNQPSKEHKELMKQRREMKQKVESMSLKALREAYPDERVLPDTDIRLWAHYLLFNLDFQKFRAKQPDFLMLKGLEHLQYLFKTRFTEYAIAHMTLEEAQRDPIYPELSDWEKWAINNHFKPNLQLPMPANATLQYHINVSFREYAIAHMTLEETQRDPAYPELSDYDKMVINDHFNPKPQVSVSPMSNDDLTDLLRSGLANEHHIRTGSKPTPEQVRLNCLEEIKDKSILEIARNHRALFLTGILAPSDLLDRAVAFVAEHAAEYLEKVSPYPEVLELGLIPLPVLNLLIANRIHYARMKRVELHQPYQLVQLTELVNHFKKAVLSLQVRN